MYACSPKGLNRKETNLHFMIKFAKKDHHFDAELILGSSKYNILPFRMLCKKLGADAVIVQIHKKSDIEFDETESIVAQITKKTHLKEADKHPAVKAIIVDSDLIEIKNS